MLTIPCVDRITNNVMLLRMSNWEKLLVRIKKKKLEYFGHIMKGTKYMPPSIIKEGKINGHRNVGRKMKLWMKNLRE